MILQIITHLLALRVSHNRISIFILSNYFLIISLCPGDEYVQIEDLPEWVEIRRDGEIDAWELVGTDIQFCYLAQHANPAVFDDVAALLR